MSTAAYECDQCGACCKALIIEVDELDLVREPRIMQHTTPFRVPPGHVLLNDNDEPLEPLIPGWQAGALLACGKNKPCPMLDGERCSIYPTRPNVCVAFRAGSEQCQDARQSMGLSELLPI